MGKGCVKGRRMLRWLGMVVLWNLMVLGFFLSGVYFEEVLTLDNKGEEGLKKLFSLRVFQDPWYKSVVSGPEGSYKNSMSPLP